MPFTPFHMGPAMVIKAVATDRFSLLVFGASQLLMDVEPLIRIIRGEPILHGFTHTYVGATLIGASATLVARPASNWLLRACRRNPRSQLLTWLCEPGQLSWGGAMASAFLGTYSHVLLDSIMHADMRPWAPMIDTNDLLGVISTSQLYLWCVASGLLGLVLLAVAFVRRKARSGVR